MPQNPGNFIPVPNPVVEDKTRLITRPWMMFFQSVVDGLVAAGDVFGPSSSLNNAIALFSGTTGKLLKAATGTGIVNVVLGVYQDPYALGKNLTVTSGPTLNAVSWVPMTIGEPPTIMSDGIGNPIWIPYNP